MAISEYKGRLTLKNTDITELFLSLQGGTCSGTIHAPAFQISSDLRLKSDLQPIPEALSKLSQVHGYIYNMQGENRAGLVAQDVKQILPEAVKPNNQSYLTIDPMAVIALLVEAVNDLQRQIEELKS